MRRKPTKAYLELQRVLKENAIREQDEAETKELKNNMEKEQKKELQNSMMKPQDQAKQQEKTKLEYSQFRDQTKSDILEAVLCKLVENSLPINKNGMEIHEENFIASIVREFVEKEGVYRLLDDMAQRTVITSQLSNAINEAYDKEIENADPKDCDTFVADKSPTSEIIDNIEGDEEMADISDLIKEKVSRATEEFIEKNIIDQEDIKDTLADVKQRIETSKTGDDAVDEEIRESYERRGRRKVMEIQRRPGGVFEQLVKNMSEAVIKNDLLRDQYTINGNINMEAVVDKCTCIYTLMETVNTLKIRPLDAERIEEFITFQ